MGLGLAVDGGGSQHDPETLGLGTHASVTRGIASGLRVGLQWDGAWFDAKLITEKRLQLSAVLEVDVPDTPLRARLGPSASPTASGTSAVASSGSGTVETVYRRRICAWR